MGRKSKGKTNNKLYVTQKEWSDHFGGKKETIEATPGKRLPFYCCAISLQPAENPVCAPDGTVFDILNIIPWLKKYKTHPVTGERLTSKQLFKIHFHKNTNGEIHCPITYKILTDGMPIVAVKTTGNVYSWDAVEQANIKLNNWRDLITDEPFTKKDLVTIHDPTDSQKKMLSNFHHIKHDMKLKEQDSDPLKNINVGSSTKRLLRQIQSKHKESDESDSSKDKNIIYTSTPTGENTKSSALTSSSQNIVTKGSSSNTIDKEHLLLYEKVKKNKAKGYVRIHTNLGHLNVELHADKVPMTCENFIRLCEKGYYNDTVFHRNIPGFMIQGGDPKGKGTGGRSIWGGSFKDEFHPHLTHSERGTLSMANMGKDTNRSQFFITFGECQHLNNKHSVFGRVVGGLDTLDRMERIETDLNDRPKSDIKIESVTVFTNPYDDAQKQIQKEEQQKKEKQEKQFDTSQHRAWFSNPAPKLSAQRSGVGKYIKKNNNNNNINNNVSNDNEQSNKAQKRSLKEPKPMPTPKRTRF